MRVEKAKSRQKGSLSFIPQEYPMLRARVFPILGRFQERCRILPTLMVTCPFGSPNSAIESYLASVIFLTSAAPPFTVSLYK